MVTLSPIFHQLGAVTAPQQRSLIKLLGVTGCLGDIPGMQDTMTSEQADAFLHALDFPSKADAAEWLHRVTQARWFNADKQSAQYRISTPSDLQPQEEELQTLLHDSGTEGKPRTTRTHYDHALVLGATEPVADARILKIKQLWDQGVRFSAITLLGSARPLIPEREPSAAALAASGKATESAMLERRYKELSQDWPEELKRVPVKLLDTQRADGKNANTRDTIKAWKDHNPKPQTVLAVSNAPYVAYQEAAIRSQLGDEYTVEMADASTGRSHTAAGLILDTLAKQIDVSMEALRAPQAELPPSVSDIALVPVDAIRQDPKRFQWRLNGNAKDGVRADNRFEGDWNPLIDGAITLGFRESNGDIYIVDGHHRLEKAKRLQAEGKGPKALAMHILDAAEGFTEQDARLIGAYLNMAKEFRDPAMRHDERKLLGAAAAFHHAQHDPNVHANVLPRFSIDGDLADAYSAGALTPAAFAVADSGAVPVAMAADVARHTKDSVLQREVMEILGEKLSSIPHTDEAYRWRNYISTRSQPLREL